MGLDVNGSQFVLHAWGRGVDFSRTLMIGRQRLFLHRWEFEANLRRLGFSWEPGAVERIIPELRCYADALFRALGAADVHSLDHSDFEGATHIHDMNIEIPMDLKERYSVVLDGGSLEHVFNFPMAIKNCMEMVRVGGHFLGITPANNFMGHGFYQFSPELFFSIFTGDNGFELEYVVACEDTPGATWFVVKSPALLRTRVTLRNRNPLHLFVAARRTRAVVPFQSHPQQSDYVSAWSRGSSDADPVRGAWRDDETTAGNHWLPTVQKYTPNWMRRALRLLRPLPGQRPGFNPAFFSPLTITDEHQGGDRRLLDPG